MTQLSSLAITDEELNRMAHTLAYDNAGACIECNCQPVRPDDVIGAWFDISEPDDCYDDLEEHVRYLEARGLIERHEDNPNWISLRNEEEATR